MKERPILFSGEMVRAILQGRKTQTRRLVMPMPAYPDAFKGVRMEFNSSRCGVDIWNSSGTLPAHFWKCPFGKPGDRLWVRETWGKGSENNVCHISDEEIFYRATDPGWDDNDTGFKWRPSIHMPRWASRITLEVVSVKVERLQDISGEDAICEGVPCSRWSEDDWVDSDGFRTPIVKRHAQAIEEFAELWDSIYGKKPGCSWADNPFVWAGEFKVVQP